MPNLQRCSSVPGLGSDCCTTGSLSHGRNVSIRFIIVASKAKKSLTDSVFDLAMMTKVGQLDYLAPLGRAFLNQKDKCVKIRVPASTSEMD